MPDGVDQGFLSDAEQLPFDRFGARTRAALHGHGKIDRAAGDRLAAHVPERGRQIAMVEDGRTQVPDGLARLPNVVFEVAAKAIELFLR